MIDLFLDIATERTFAEKARSNWWLIVIALVALAGIIGLFIWRKRKSKQQKK